MIFSDLNGILWFSAFLIIFIFVQRRTHREIQTIFYLLTRRLNWAYGLFALILLPGVFLHEISHFLTAKVLGVRTGKFSIFPREAENGKLRMGYVEVERVGFLRNAIIGTAPLIVGFAAILWISFNPLNMAAIWDALLEGQIEIIINSQFFEMIMNRPWAWLWFYLLLVISSSMLPSESDRREWLLAVVIVLGMILIAWLAGAGTWLWETFWPLVNRMFAGLAIVFGISLFVHFVIWLPFGLLRVLLQRMMRASFS
ncbi:MAG: hypothetical protein JEZ06_02805 [Anaerolineaceae bacterium]|nr:hypothetical protein [Anaerolineaceae bacterium]